MMQSDAVLYQQVSPSGLLAPYVVCFWILKAPAHLLPERERRPADGCTDVVFQLNGTYKHSPADGRVQIPMLHGSVVLGQRSQGYVIEPGGDTYCVAIRFRPGGLAAFMPLPAYELTDQAVDLDRIWGNEVTEWEEQLFNAPSLEHCREILTQILCSRFEDRPNQRVIQAAVQQIDMLGGNFLIRTLADDFGWSLKHLERLFAQYVGLAPKYYARIARFRRLSRFAARPPSDRNIGWLAADFGYYDQSHLAREVTSLAGVAPREFFSLWCPVCGGAPLHLQGCSNQRG